MVFSVVYPMSSPNENYDYKICLIISKIQYTSVHLKNCRCHYLNNNITILGYPRKCVEYMFFYFNDR